MDDVVRFRRFTGVASALLVMLSLWFGLMGTAFAQTLTASKTTASPLAINHAVTVNFALQ